jgi:protein-S-isoprenylcysteine O-methyltransferase Ste14
MSQRLQHFVFTDVTYYTEKYLLSFFMLYYGLKNLFLAIGGIHAASLGQGSPNTAPIVLAYYPVVKYFILSSFNLFTGSLLLSSKRPQQSPKDWQAILIPVLSSYSILAYNFVGYFPSWMTVNYLPDHFLFGAFIASCALSVAGQLLSFFAVFYLRRSFAIFIQLREVISSGPYRYIRHPMYTGYVILTAGMLLANACVAYLLVAIVHTALLAYRARLEENAIAASDPVYKKHMEHTGFLFPRLSVFSAS